MRLVTAAKSLLLKRPILVIFDVTRLCNQRCRFCNIWRGESRDMAAGEIVRQAEFLKKLGIGYVFLQGGEPTLRPDLPEIVDAFIGREIKPTVITNGILLKDGLARKLAEKRCNVAISLDTLDAASFKLIRGVDSLDLVMANLENIAGIKPRRGNWAVTTTVTNLSTLEEIKRLEALAGRLGLMYAIRPYVHVAGAAGRRDDCLLYRDIERVVEIFAYMRDRARKNNYLASLVYEGHIDWLRGKPMPGCDALARSLVMSPQGLFSPCLEFTSESVPWEEIRGRRAAWLERCRICNREHPCFYNCAREIGILWRNKWRIALTLPLILGQLARHRNFF
ncbi:MAG: radical SAM protein [Planctomycetota bacterium]|jgi:MoaA/NifB/PqqE/SkfB family radical SAM enzyme|nr:radical SAM protein [Planctomycetota bacterium]